MKNKQEMGNFLNKAKVIMEKSQQLKPIVPSSGQPTLSESARMEGVSTGSDFDEYYEQPQYVNTQQTMSPASNKLPKSILESIQNNPIQEYGGSGMGISVLDDIMPTMQRPQQRQQQRPQQINEDLYYGEKAMPTTEEMIYKKFGGGSRQMYNEQQYSQPAYQQQQAPAIDYSIISSIIKTTIAEEIAKLSKKLLNESKATTNGGDVIVKAGDGIKFITNSGKVYEGKLKFIGNLRD